MNAESNPAVFGEIGKRHLISYCRRFVFRSHRLHYRSFFRIGVTAVSLVSQPTAVRIGLDIKPAAGKSESQRRITALLYQPTVLLSGLIDRISLFIFHRISLLIQSRHFFMSGVLFENSGLIQLYKLVNRQLFHFTFRSLHKRTVGHTVPLGKNGRHIAIQRRRNIYGELIVA